MLRGLLGRSHRGSSWLIGPGARVSLRTRTGPCHEVLFMSGRCSPSLRLGLGKRGDEPVAAASFGRDESRLAPVILELGPQVTNMAVYGVAFGYVVDAPECIHDLIAGQHPAGVGGEEVEQTLLERREMQ